MKIILSVFNILIFEKCSCNDCIMETYCRVDRGSLGLQISKEQSGLLYVQRKRLKGNYHVNISDSKGFRRGGLRGL